MKTTTLALAAAFASSAGSALAQGVPGAVAASSQPHPQISVIQQNDGGPLAWVHGLFQSRDRATETSRSNLPAEVRTPDRARG